MSGGTPPSGPSGDVENQGAGVNAGMSSDADEQPANLESRMWTSIKMFTLPCVCAVMHGLCEPRW